MRVGTKSLLFGAHCFFIHPWFVAAGWINLYGFPFDPRLWIAFFIHDWGYWGKYKMDDENGESHPLWAARIMGAIFGQKWYYFCLCHSRFWSKRIERKPSRLCYADKCAIFLEPWWLYIPRAWLSGEIHEYRKESEDNGKYSNENVPGLTYREWFFSMCEYLKKWVGDNSNKHKEKDSVSIR